MVVEQGEVLPKSLEIKVRPLYSDFVDVSGFGALDWVELTHHSDDAKSTRFSGPLQLLSLRGRIRRAGNLIISDFYQSGSIQITPKLTQHRSNFIELMFPPFYNIVPIYI